MTMLIRARAALDASAAITSVVAAINLRRVIEPAEFLSSDATTTPLN
jgi:hypothetical protein